nr:immunoglobulin heavy chain junction region [Mus musculus]
CGRDHYYGSSWYFDVW